MHKVLQIYKSDHRREMMQKFETYCTSSRYIGLIHYPSLKIVE